MAIYEDISVEVPQTVSIKKSGKYRYVYLLTGYYQSRNGIWTNKSRAIGRLNEDDEEGKSMHPNDQYFEIFNLPHPRSDRVQLILNAGHTRLLNHRANDLGMVEILSDVFGPDYRILLQTAFYMVCEGNVMMYLDDFYEISDPVYPTIVSDNHLNQLYATITKDKIWDFFRQWMARYKLQDDALAYDVTGISSCSENLEQAQPRYKRDGENLPQINLCLMYSRKLKLPLCYELYDASVPDNVFLKSMHLLAREFKLDIVLAVMDKGFLTQDRLQYLVENKIPFILAFPDGQEVFEAILLSEADSIRDPDNYQRSLKCYGHRKRVDVNGLDFYACSYLSSGKAEDDEIFFSDKLQRDEERLQRAMGEKMRNTRMAYFDVEMDNEELLSYQRDMEAVSKSWKTLGMFGLLTNVENLGCESALTIYLQKDRIGKNYDNMKNNVDYPRLRTHYDQDAQGKFFIGFLAQILYADLVSHLGDDQKKPVASTKKQLKQLQKIRKVHYADGEKLAAPLTKTQKEILANFGISPEEFIRELFVEY